MEDVSKPVTIQWAMHFYLPRFSLAYASYGIELPLEDGR